MPLHSKSWQCRTIQKVALTHEGLRCRVLQEVFKTLTSFSWVRLLSPSCFLAFCHFACPLYTSHLPQVLLYTFTWIHVYFSSCNRKKSLFCFIACFVLSRACTWQCSETVWNVTRGRQQGVFNRLDDCKGPGVEPGVELNSSYFPESCSTTQNASWCRNCNLLHASCRHMRNKQESTRMNYTRNTVLSLKATEP